MKPEKKTAPRKRAAASASEPRRVSQTPGPRVRRAARTPVSNSPEPIVELKPEEKTVTSSAASTESAVGKHSLKVPPILLEGDGPAAPAAGGPGQRYALGPAPPPEHFGATGELGELPEAYGTEKLLLTARDPNWLYAHWDLTHEQLREYNRRSADGHLVLRVFIDQVAGEPFVEAQVNPESRNWFVHVGRGGTKFVAVLGYYATSGARWTQLSVSAPTLTPPDSLSPDTSVHFATIPVDVPFEKLLAIVKAAVSESVPLAQAVQHLRAEGYAELPNLAQISSARWTPEQERALAELISMDPVRRVWIGSLEITELVRRRQLEDISSGAVASVSSPFGGVERPKGFWFNVNAELIIYGATEPNAKVAIGGRDIQLRPDGSFSFRFALPDGHYELPVTAISADQTDARAAELRFDRQTEYRGDVGAHPQDAKLKPPRTENVAR
jgi:hypothetical protein